MALTQAFLSWVLARRARAVAPTPAHAQRAKIGRGRGPPCPVAATDPFAGRERVSERERHSPKGCRPPTDGDLRRAWDIPRRCRASRRAGSRARPDARRQPSRAAQVWRASQHRGSTTTWPSHGILRSAQIRCSRGSRVRRPSPTVRGRFGLPRGACATCSPNEAL